MLLEGKNSVTVLGNGKPRVAPLFGGDVVMAILTALESDKSGTFDLQGPEEMTIDDLVRLLNGLDRVRLNHVPRTVAGLLRFVGPKLPSALIETMLTDSRSDNPTAKTTFNLSLTSLHKVWVKLEFQDHLPVCQLVVVSPELDKIVPKSSLIATALIWMIAIPIIGQGFPL
jgi:hypothetical protein